MIIFFYKKVIGYEIIYIYMYVYIILLGTPKHSEMVCRNWPVPKYLVPLDKLKRYS